MSCGRAMCHREKWKKTEGKGEGRGSKKSGKREGEGEKERGKKCSSSKQSVFVPPEKPGFEQL